MQAERIKSRMDELNAEPARQHSLALREALRRSEAQGSVDRILIRGLAPKPREFGEPWTSGDVSGGYARGMVSLAKRDCEGRGYVAKPCPRCGLRGCIHGRVR
jgi:hypothetical protein